MRRFLVLSIALAGALVAWGLSPPETENGLATDLPDPRSATSRQGIWYCPGASAETDPIAQAAVTSPAAVQVSLPADGAFVDSFPTRLSGPGVAKIDVGDGLRFHPGPVLVEVSTSPSAASVTFAGPAQMAADTCQTAAKEWFLPGGTLTPGQTLTLRLYNPLLEPALVSTQLVSEFGFEPLLDLAQLSVAARDWVDVELGPPLGERTAVAVSVRTSEGVVVPSFVSSDPNGLAVWSGEGLSPTWAFPIAQVEGTTGTLSVWNLGEEQATVEVLVSTETRDAVAADLVVAPGREERFDLATITFERAGLSVRSDVPVAAAVVAAGPAGRLATSGVPRTARRWLVPVSDALPGAQFELAILNTESETTEVVITPLGATTGDTISVPSGRVAVVAPNERGVEVLSSGPVSVAWVLAGSDDVALALATAIPTEFG